MFMVQFVHSNDETFVKTTSCGFHFNSDNFENLWCAEESLRFLRRLGRHAEVKGDRSVMAAIGDTISLFILEYRKVVCANLKECGTPVPWDIEKYGKIERSQLHFMASTIAGKFADKSISDDAYVSWFTAEMSKRTPFLKLEVAV